MATEVKDTVMSLPLEIVETSGGFSVDIGGSMAKIVYRSNKDYKNGKTLNPEETETRMGRVHAVLFPRADTDVYVKYLQDNCDVTSGGTVYGTGTGGSQYKEPLEKGLGVVMQNVSEFHCFQASINTLLENFPIEEWLEPINEVGAEEGLKYLQMIKVMQDMTAGRELLTPEEFDATYRTQVETYMVRLKEQRKHLVGCPYPYLMVLCGSAFGLILVQEDGSMELVEVNMMSGRFFLGAAAVMTGEKDYHKIIEACETHDGRTVDILGRDQLSDNAGDQDDHYSKLDPAARIFPFGKGHDADRSTICIQLYTGAISRVTPLTHAVAWATRLHGLKEYENDTECIRDGDVLSSLNQSVCENLALVVYETARANKVRHAYFCGGFVTQEIARRYITKGMVWRNLSIPSSSNQRVHFDFIANSGQLGSIGAFMYGRKPNKSYK